MRTCDLLETAAASQDQLTHDDQTYSSVSSERTPTPITTPTPTHRVIICCDRVLLSPPPHPLLRSRRFNPFLFCPRSRSFYQQSSDCQSPGSPTIFSPAHRGLFVSPFSSMLRLDICVCQCLPACI
ncbi:hypothetical protein ABVT39_019991 [Epinephelus coioides]